MLKNIFERLPADTSEEIFEELIKDDNLKLERIISTGQATPPGQWLSQEADEWVLLLSGQAKLLVKGELSPRVLKPGDYIHLPARCSHRVEWTDPENITIWLALHFKTGQKITS